MIISLTCIYVLVLAIIYSFKSKRVINVISFAFIGIYLPLFLYQLGWSTLIDKTNSDFFNYMFVLIALLLTLFSVLSYKIKPKYLHKEDKICIKKSGSNFCILLSVFYLLTYLIENYLGSGSLAPILKGIDIHTYSAPIISFITQAQFFFMIIDYLCWKATHKKRFLILISLIFLTPIITRLSRMNSIISLFQLLVVAFSLRKHGKTFEKKSKGDHKKTLFTIILIFIFCIFLFYVLLKLSDLRLKMNGATYTYSDRIKFSGPSWLNWLSTYYGYFALSFNNLKINILYRTISHNYIGLYSFSFFYFGILQLDNIVGLNIEGQLVGRLITSDAATVPTAFWDYYYDFGILFWIPIVVALLLMFYLLKRCSKERKGIVFRVIFYWYITGLIFCSFQNILYLPITFFVGIISFLFIKHFFFIESKTTIKFILNRKNYQRFMIVC